MCPSVESWSLVLLLSAGRAAALHVGKARVPLVIEYKHLEIINTPDGEQDAYIKQRLTQGNARVLQIRKLPQDKHLSVQVKRMLTLIAIGPLLKYGAEVLVPTNPQCKSLESEQLKATRMMSDCPAHRPLMSLGLT